VYDYLILTAAITRPDLHAELFRSHLTLIGTASVKWLVNIDDVGNGCTVAETAAQLRRLLDAPNVDLEVLHEPGPGCFFRASRVLARRADELLDECHTGVIWLEDDWALQKRGPGAELLTALRLRLSKNRLGGPLQRCPGDLVAKQGALEAHERRHGPRWFVSLVPRSRVSFNPGIWSKALFRESILAPLETAGERVDDPETLCADPLNDPDRYHQLVVLVDPRYQDAGRLWSARSGLRKWHKSAAGLQARGAVSYQAFEQTPTAPAFDLGTTVLCPDLLLNTPLRLLCRTRRLNEGLRLGIAGVSGLGFAVVPQTDERADLFTHRLHAWSRTYPVKRAPVTLRREARQVWLESGTGAARPLASPGRLDHLWRPGLQALIGLLASAASLPKVLARLDAE
jgi:hypothetical protein